MPKNKIHTKYQPRPEETTLLQQDVSKLAGSWDLPEFDQFKKNLISYLRGEQENSCCYCKSDLSDETGMITIEHIMCKDRNPKFTYHLGNLALACHPCNTIKGIKKVTKKEPNIRRYPISPKTFTIPHPHLDEYDNHIIWLSGILPQGVSNKGLELIAMCHLLRPGLLINNSKIIATSDNPLVIKIEELRSAPPEKVPRIVALLIQDILMQKS
jgi:uncharacterized protein (TIGR02646 family)